MDLHCHLTVGLILQDEEKKAKAEAREADKKRLQEEKDAVKEHARAKEIAAKAVSRIGPVLTEMMPKVKDANNTETESFKQLPMLMKTQLRASLEELQTINSIASACLSGNRKDVEFDAEYVKVAASTGCKLLKNLANLS